MTPVTPVAPSLLTHGVLTLFPHLYILFSRLGFCEEGLGFGHSQLFIMHYKVVFQFFSEAGCSYTQRQQDFFLHHDPFLNS